MSAFISAGKSPWVIIWLLLVISILTQVKEAEAACNGCHGTQAPAPVDYRPLDESTRNPETGGFPGSHRTHMDQTTNPAICAKCHSGSHIISSHREGYIKLSPKINFAPSSVLTTYTTTATGKFSPHTSAWLQTSSPILGNCNTVNCHFEKITPDWGSSSASTDCNTCHSSPPSNGASNEHHPGTSGTGKKHGDYLGTGLNSCSYCHVDHNSEAAPFAHATSAGKRSLIVNFSRYSFADASYTGDVSYPKYLPSQSTARDGACGNYCHSNAAGGPPNVALTWSDTRQSKCFSCHGGRSGDETQANCAERGGTWTVIENPITGFINMSICTPYAGMSSNGHGTLTGKKWIRKYACANCHADTVTFHNDGKGHLVDDDLIIANHVNGKKDIKMPVYWNIPGKPFSSYSSSTKTCYNVYCHSDGTNDAKSDVKPFSWDDGKAGCNACHGHPNGNCVSCHYVHTDSEGKTWTYIPDWPADQKWKAAIPMFPNEGPGRPRANSHPKHTQKDFTCNKCHAETIANGTCNTACHTGSGVMTEVAHINPDKHVNKSKNVIFLAPAAHYDDSAKTCSGTGTGCHGGMADPLWGGSASGASSDCMGCHGNSSGPDTDNYIYHSDGSNQAKINLQEWYSSGHGRISAKGPYKSGNPAANFTANACWYCHDSKVMHNESSINPFRLWQHEQFKSRFDKECAYCHMEGKDVECLRCHNASGGESLAPQLSSILKNETTAKWPDGEFVVRPDHASYTTCIRSSTDGCHYVDPNDTKNDLKIHNEGAGFWTTEQNADIKNQYVQMGVCLQCHDDDSNDRCAQCHGIKDGGGNFVKTAFGNISVSNKYKLGFTVGSLRIKPSSARATSAHFGYKHYKAFNESGGWDPVTGKAKGTWKGGKFCWDCHDPHGDSNIFMIHDQVATSTDGKFGKPLTRSPVRFLKKETGSDYITKNNEGPPFLGICNVCHSDNSKHYKKDSSDSHNQTRVCTTCHEHRFSDSHAGSDPCNACHRNKPVPRHSGFGLPRDCTKCHAGPILNRMDVMTQFNANSHHVQGVTISNRHCYACHWEATDKGLINIEKHTGFNYKNYSTVPGDLVDLVIWGPGVRPTTYKLYSSAIQFNAGKVSFGVMSTERKEVAKVTPHCISCHSDQNNDALPFNDCKTPRQYAWDGLSIDARYSQSGWTNWGKYGTNGKSAVKKAFSAHGNAKVNQGGWSNISGLDGAIPNTRDGSKNVQCFDCHSSHGSKVGVGVPSVVTTSYVTFNGTRNGGNLKETQAGKGGYSMTYKASLNAIPSAVNPYNAGAGQCIDCHMNATAGATPWGFKTFSASQPIKNYNDGYKFMSRTLVAGYGVTSKMKNDKAIVGGHLKASPGAIQTPNEQINGICTPCHDPHGVSPALGSKQAYAVPMLKGTWMTSPYKEDHPAPKPNSTTSRAGATSVTWGRKITDMDYAQSGLDETKGEPIVRYNLDRNTFGAGKTIVEDDQSFAGLCLRCHGQEKLIAPNATTSPQWKSVDRIHRTVKGWGVNGTNKEHSFTCSKCHQPHNSTLPRLMLTDCLDYRHRGSYRDNVYTDGVPWSAKNSYDDDYAHQPFRGNIQIRLNPATEIDEHRGFPAASMYGRYVEYNTTCHANAPNKKAEDQLPWPDNQSWNSKTPW